jgi:hypothetical protein
VAVCCNEQKAGSRENSSAKEHGIYQKKSGIHVPNSNDMTTKLVGELDGKNNHIQSIFHSILIIIIIIINFYEEKKLKLRKPVIEEGWN